MGTLHKNIDYRNPHMPASQGLPLFTSDSTRDEKAEQIGRFVEEFKPVEGENDMPSKEDYEPSWESKCESCEESPTVPVSGLCGPCHFGNSGALGGDWWNHKLEDFNEENI